MNSHESLRKVDSLVQKIEGLCKSIEQSLALCMEINSDSVGSYSTGTAGQISSEFVDRIILTIQKIKNQGLRMKILLMTYFIILDVGKLKNTILQIMDYGRSTKQKLINSQLEFQIIL